MSEETDKITTQVVIDMHIHHIGSSCSALLRMAITSDKSKEYIAANAAEVFVISEQLSALVERIGEKNDDET